ncbi:MAG: cobyrinate a,c-diamide synthase [bacterium]
MKHAMQCNIKRIVISGLSGGCGKTFVSIGIASALKRQGMEVFPFKKGPDYIDSAWLSVAAEAPCYNLDTFLMGEKGVINSFETHTGVHDVCRFCDAESCSACNRLEDFLKDRIAIIEGNRGLFDGMDENGTYSTAELSKLLKTGVVLVLDSTKSTRTLAAEVLGCQKMDNDVRIVAVILNRVAGKRHEEIVRTSIEKICGVPVIGAIPKLDDSKFPERHLGLITPDEYPGTKDAITYATNVAQSYVDIRRLIAISNTNEALTVKTVGRLSGNKNKNKSTVRIGIIRDAAFSFYYPDNIEALKTLGAEIVHISALEDHTLPDIDALYIGGGFPETNAIKLAQNESFKVAVKEAVEDGLPVYAECGGAIYMGRSMTYNNQTYPMTGILPLEFYFLKKPQGHGYTILESIEENPFFELHSILHGHEFHYSKANSVDSKKIKFVFNVRKGYGFNGERDGILYKNLLAIYSHIHAAGTSQWAANLIKLAERFSELKKHKNFLKYKKELFYDYQQQHIDM